MVLKTVNEIYYYNSHYAYHNDDDDGWITHNYDNDDPTPDNNNKRLIDWEDETSVDYFSEVNSISNRRMLIEGCDHHHHCCAFFFMITVHNALVLGPDGVLELQDLVQFVGNLLSRSSSSSGHA